MARSPARVENLSLSALIYLENLKCCRCGSWESFIISLDILTCSQHSRIRRLRIFHYQPWYTYVPQWDYRRKVENLSLSALIYLDNRVCQVPFGWESFIISLDILSRGVAPVNEELRIFHYQPWYTYGRAGRPALPVENLSLSALIYLSKTGLIPFSRWESFIISLDILNVINVRGTERLRIFHYQPWYT